MNDVQLLLLALAGRLTIYALQKFPPVRNIWFLFELVSCDFCLGVWVYSVLSGLMRWVLFQDMYYVPIISEILTGISISFLVHIFAIGWQSRFGTIVIEDK
uniref:DUF1360 domain-containing protein n=1 Tax=viral metagenome TaxID=1070528 RepID=A0A6H1ZAU1_9ZZZZ